MKRSAGILLGFLLLGLASGSAFAKLSNSFSAESNAIVKAPAQERVLIGLVAESQAEVTDLMGLWLMVRSGSDLHWMPIYPQPLTEEADRYALAHKALQIGPGAETLWEGLAPVREAGANWDVSVLLDIEGLEALSRAAGIGTAQELAASWEEPQKALAQQVETIQSWCQGRPSGASLDTALGLIEQGAMAVSGWGRFELIGAWDQLFGGAQGPTCQHPWAQ